MIEPGDVERAPTVPTKQYVYAFSLASIPRASTPPSVKTAADYSGITTRWTAAAATRFRCGQGRPRHLRRLRRLILVRIYSAPPHLSPERDRSTSRPTT
jgi:hypothetical protein